MFRTLKQSLGKPPQAISALLHPKLQAIPRRPKNSSRNRGSPTRFNGIYHPKLQELPQNQNIAPAEVLLQPWEHFSIQLYIRRITLINIKHTDLIGLRHPLERAVLFQELH